MFLLVNSICMISYTSFALTTHLQKGAYFLNSESQQSEDQWSVLS